MVKYLVFYSFLMYFCGIIGYLLGIWSPFTEKRSSMIDAIDIDILRILQENANATTKEISLKLHLTTTPIHERIKRLVKDGYIKKYVAILNKEKLNKGLTVFCNISLKQHTSKIGHEFVAEIGLLEEVVECYNISGDYDFLLKVLVADMPGYQQFVMNRLGSL